MTGFKTEVEIYGKLGESFIELANNFENSSYLPLLNKASAHNPWFTPTGIQTAFSALGNSLSPDNLNTWLSAYKKESTGDVKNIGLVMAGNIPLVGFHDLLCVLVTGHTATVKLSSKDQWLYTIVKQMLVEIDNSFANRIEFTDEPLKNIDAIIATGSNNSSRYFEYFFKKYPHIIRQNRNSVAVITGAETESDFKNLGDDIFTYFGLGCRNVSFLYLPVGYDVAKIMEGLDPFSQVMQHTKYANNYDYQKTIMLMNLVPFHDNGFLLLKADTGYASPIGVIHYQYYNDLAEVEEYLKTNSDKIQCVVSKTNLRTHTYELGEAQKPALWDYADNVNTLEFLLNLNHKV